MRIQKFFCDFCQKEVSGDKITCQIQYVKWNILKKNVQPEPIQMDICTFCQDKVIKAIEDLRTREAIEEVKKDREETNSQCDDKLKSA